MSTALIPVTYYVTWNSDTIWATRYTTLQALTYLEAWDRCEAIFARTFTVYAEAGWKNYQGLTVAQRRALTTITWHEAVAGWVPPPKQPSPYQEGV